MKPASVPSPSAYIDRAGAQRAVRHIISRHFFGTAAVVALVAALIFSVLPTGIAPGARWSLVLAFAALGALAASSLHAGVARIEDMVALVVIAALAVITLAATLLDWGIAGPGIGFFGLMTCMVCAVAGLRLGVLVAALAALMVLALAYAQWRHWLPAGSAALSPESLGLRTLIHLIVIGSGLAGGLLVSRVISGYVRSADEREQRFRGLLTIAADAYWEIDAQYRLVTFKRQGRRGGSLGEASAVGQVPWEVPELGLDDDTLDLLRAHLEARESFRDLAVQWLGVPGQVRHFLISGEPRQPAGAPFQGYWGVARDVSGDVRAREKLLATESRYLELFTRIPTPLLLHMQGRVLDANPAALGMFGFAELQAMIGAELLPMFEGGDSRERARRRIEALQQMDTGETLPVAEFRLTRQDGRRVVARATGVRLDTPDGPAILSIFVDDTERKKAEDAVRRSEAMLSHLVATSPDLITLTELQSGRYAMVNRSFERQTGYSAAEAVGRCADELGVWRQPQEHERFVAAVRDQGHVQDMPTEFTSKGGAVRSMLVSGARFAMDRRDYLVINARDVTEAERERLQREAILQNASIGIAVTREQRFVVANPRFEQMYGWPPGAMAGQSGRVVWDSDDDYQRIGAELGPKLLRGESAEVETLARRFDGSSFLARVTGKAIDPANPVGGGTIWIVDDITERRQVEQALARARDAAEAANRAKSAFLANTSHELRTPLNGLIGLARLAAAPETSEARRHQYLLQIGDTAQALSEIISDILDLSKIEAGKLELEAAPFDLGELLRGMQRAYAPLAEAKAIALRLQLEAGVDGPVLGDTLRTRQILNNYLSNALRFTSRGEVRLDARRLDTLRVRIEVHDTGPGIAADTQARLFRPFTQADESTTRRYGGTGLGLSICRELAALMGGEVGLHSRPGEGSCFWVELPLPVAAAPAPEPAPLPEDEDALQGASVLMVEDNPVNMLIAATLLENWGVRVEQATDGQQALQAVQRRASAGSLFDAVLMDVQMPVMSGHEATRALRRDYGAEQLPIIALTAAALVSEREQALAAGMNDFLTKPVDALRLRRTLLRWIAPRRAARQGETRGA
ncbi:MAG TPA: PAS domain S-box protein [Rubrivivax sp.]|nr:PAS domain S-box protein [Rubrivivax sp.]